DALEEVEIERAIVDGIADLHGEGGGPEGDVVVERVDGSVDPGADAVTHGERRHEGQHEVRSRRSAPDAEGLAEVGPLELEPHFLARAIEEPADAQGGVDEEAAHLLG